MDRITDNSEQPTKII